MQEHRVIAHAGEALQRQIEAILGGAIVPRAEVEMAAATFLVYYGNHIAREEEDVLTRAGAARPALRQAGAGALPRAAATDRAGSLAALHGKPGAVGAV
jgi:hypothetical protein